MQVCRYGGDARRSAAKHLLTATTQRTLDGTSPSVPSVIYATHPDGDPTAGTASRHATEISHIARLKYLFRAPPAAPTSIQHSVASSTDHPLIGKGQ